MRCEYCGSELDEWGYCPECEKSIIEYEAMIAREEEMSLIKRCIKCDREMDPFDTASACCGEEW